MKRILVGAVKGAKSGAAGKSVVFGLPERNRRIYTRAVESVSADELLAHIRAYQEKIGLHHRYIPQLSFLEKVWKISYR